MPGVLGRKFVEGRCHAFVGRAVGAEEAVTIDEPVADHESHRTGCLTEGGSEALPFVKGEVAGELEADGADVSFGRGEVEDLVHGIGWI